MVYRVIGLMSGSSLDGLDIAFVELEESRGKWSFRLIAAECLNYDEEWQNKLSRATELSVAHFLCLNTSFGQYLAAEVNNFISRNELEHQVHFIASHGHTVFHDPVNRVTSQIGDGATISAATGLPVISDLRSLDIAFGGQGAPIVPIGDKLLFGAYDYLLNIGGIANLTILNDGRATAFDVCPANQILNVLARKEGLEMDTDGLLASQGTLLHDVLADLNNAQYYHLPPPKSLSNEQARDVVFPVLSRSAHDNKDALYTVVEHITIQIATAVAQFPVSAQEPQLLVTGGGAFNSHLMRRLAVHLHQLGVHASVPEASVIKFKEAIVMALIGALRWREEPNVLCSVTGASSDSIGGALWMGRN